MEWKGGLAPQAAVRMSMSAFSVSVHGPGWPSLRLLRWQPVARNRRSTRTIPESVDAKDDLNTGSSSIRRSRWRVEGRAVGTLGPAGPADMAYAQWKTSERVQAVATIDRFIKVVPFQPGDGLLST